MISSTLRSFKGGLISEGKHSYLTAVFFETGAMPTPTKLQNLTNCGLGGS